MNLADQAENYRLFEHLHVMEHNPKYGFLFLQEYEQNYLNELIQIGLCVEKNRTYNLTFRGMWVLHTMRDKGYRMKKFKTGK
jgi:hypothetical protein